MVKKSFNMERYLENSVPKCGYYTRYGTHEKGASWLEHEICYSTNSNSTAQCRILNVDDLEPVLPKFEREICVSVCKYDGT